ncbi:conserved Plasmodium protein, unknown function [Plasmodium sp. gorilla clade G3]|nr:conserved Plasmodium protein, unknown function [Plasmodium sp. gorilla clade G3]
MTNVNNNMNNSGNNSAPTNEVLWESLYNDFNEITDRNKKHFNYIENSLFNFCKGVSSNEELSYDLSNRRMTDISHLRKNNIGIKVNMNNLITQKSRINNNINENNNDGNNNKNNKQELNNVMLNNNINDEYEKESNFILKDEDVEYIKNDTYISCTDIMNSEKTRNSDNFNNSYISSSANINVISKSGSNICDSANNNTNMKDLTDINHNNNNDDNNNITCNEEKNNYFLFNNNKDGLRRSSLFNLKSKSCHNFSLPDDGFYNYHNNNNNNNKSSSNYYISNDFSKNKLRLDNKYDDHTYLLSNKKIYDTYKERKSDKKFITFNTFDNHSEGSVIFPMEKYRNFTLPSEEKITSYNFLKKRNSTFDSLEKLDMLLKSKYKNISNKYNNNNNYNNNNINHNNNLESENPIADDAMSHSYSCPKENIKKNHFIKSFLSCEHNYKIDSVMSEIYNRNTEIDKSDESPLSERNAEIDNHSVLINRSKKLIEISKKCLSGYSDVASNNMNDLYINKKGDHVNNIYDNICNNFKREESVSKSLLFSDKNKQIETNEISQNGHDNNNNKNNFDHLLNNFENVGSSNGYDYVNHMDNVQYSYDTEEDEYEDYNNVDNDNDNFHGKKQKKRDHDINNDHIKQNICNLKVVNVINQNNNHNNDIISKFKEEHIEKNGKKINTIFEAYDKKNITQGKENAFKYNSIYMNNTQGGDNNIHGVVNNGHEKIEIKTEDVCSVIKEEEDVLINIDRNNVLLDDDKKKEEKYVGNGGGVHTNISIKEEHDKNYVSDDHNIDDDDYIYEKLKNCKHLREKDIIPHVSDVDVEQVDYVGNVNVDEHVDDDYDHHDIEKRKNVDEKESSSLDETGSSARKIIMHPDFVEKYLQNKKNDSVMGYQEEMKISDEQKKALDKSVSVINYSNDVKRLFREKYFLQDLCEKRKVMVQKSKIENTKLNIEIKSLLSFNNNLSYALKEKDAEIKILKKQKEELEINLMKRVNNNTNNNNSNPYSFLNNSTHLSLYNDGKRNSIDNNCNVLCNKSTSSSIILNNMNDANETIIQSYEKKIQELTVQLKMYQTKNNDLQEQLKIFMNE